MVSLWRFHDVVQIAGNGAAATVWGQQSVRRQPVMDDHLPRLLKGGAKCLLRRTPEPVAPLLVPPSTQAEGGLIAVCDRMTRWIDQNRPGVHVDSDFFELLA